jgi:chromosome segregation ATPase
MADEQPWLTLTDAAQRSGLAREAIRARARRRLIPSRRGNRGEMLVQLPADLLAGAGQGLAEPPAVDSTGLPAGMADLMAEVAELREKLARLEAERDAAKAVAVAEQAAAVAEANSKAAALRELVDELKQLLAEARRPWWRRLLP